MYKKILVPYVSPTGEKRHGGCGSIWRPVCPAPRSTVLSVVDWHDFNAETFKIASRMSGVMGDTMDMDVISEVRTRPSRPT